MNMWRSARGEIPRAHLCAASLFIRQDPIRFVLRERFVSSLHRVYSETTTTIDISQLSNDGTLSPVHRRGRGRPPTRRIRSVLERYSHNAAVSKRSGKQADAGDAQVESGETVLLFQPFQQKREKTKPKATSRVDTGQVALSYMLRVRHGRYNFIFLHFLKVFFVFIFLRHSRTNQWIFSKVMTSQNVRIFRGFQNILTLSQNIYTGSHDPGMI